MAVNYNDPFLRDEITFVEKTHQYFNKDNEEYKSVSRMLNGLKVPFDSARMSGLMAGKYAAENGISVDQAQKEILSSWETNKDESIDKGNYVHDSLERYAIKGTCDEEMQEACNFLRIILKEHYRYYPETIVHSHRYKIAGTTDNAMIRQKSKSPVVDFYDYKSNKSKGIQYDSIKRTDELKHYNRFLLPPFDYLEDCNYTIYSLQLSLYAFMAVDSNPDIRIGRLGIIFVDNEFKPSLIPVPFMYQEAKTICELNLTRKTLPEHEVINVSPESKIIDGTKADPSINNELKLTYSEDW